MTARCQGAQLPKTSPQRNKNFFFLIIHHQAACLKLKIDNSVDKNVLLCSVLAQEDLVMCYYSLW